MKKELDNKTTEQHIFKQQSKNKKISTNKHIHGHSHTTRCKNTHISL